MTFGLRTGIDLTTSLFVAGLAFTDELLPMIAKVGTLKGSALARTVGSVLLLRSGAGDRLVKDSHVLGFFTNLTPSMRNQHSPSNNRFCLSADQQCVRHCVRRGAKASPLTGGLDNCGVFRIDLTWTAPGGEFCSDRFFVKRLSGGAIREFAVSKALAGATAAQVMPAIYGAEWLGHDEAHLYYEFIEVDAPWPWADTSTSVSVLQALAQLHKAPLLCSDGVGDWDYDSDLLNSATTTIALFASAVYTGALGGRPMLRPLERIMQTLPAMRAALRSSGRLPFFTETSTLGMRLSEARTKCVRLFCWIG